jgi:hypothetical protein
VPRSQIGSAIVTPAESVAIAKEPLKLGSFTHFILKSPLQTEMPPFAP